MIIYFNKSLFYWASEHYVDFKYFSIERNDSVLTISEYEKDIHGGDLFACMYLFKETDGVYSYIPYKSREYYKFFSNKDVYQNKRRLGFINAKELIDYIKNNESEEYVFNTDTFLAKDAIY